MNKTYRYYGSCIDLDGDDINNMRDKPCQVSYSTFMKHSHGVKEIAKVLGYGRDTGLSLKRDWHVAFYKSTFRGSPCYYFVHSAIEFIWIKD